MKLILFGASVFYLLGLKLTTQIPVKPHFMSKPAAVESKTFQENKEKENEKLAKPEITGKDSTVSVGKANQNATKSNQKNIKFQGAGKGSV